MWKTVLFFGAVILGVLGWWSVMVFTRGEFEEISLLPSEINLVDKYIEGDKIEVAFRITNKSLSDYTVKKLSASCGCLALEIDGRPLPSGGLKMSPGEARDISVHWSTVGKYGLQQQRVFVHGELDNRSIDCSSIVSADIISGPRVLPPSIYIPPTAEEPALARFIVYAGSGAQQVAIDGATCSSETITVEFTKLTPELSSEYSTKNLTALYQLDLTVRRPISHKIELREFVEIEFNNGFGMINVPVTIAPLQASRAVFFPSTLLLPIGATGSKTVVVAESEGELKVIDKPEFLTVTVTEKPFNRELQIDYTTPKSLPELPAEYAVTIVSAGTESVLRVVIADP